MEITIKIERKRLADLMCCAMEGGAISYWACVIEYVKPPTWVTESVNPYIAYPMCEAGGGLVIGDAERRCSTRPGDAAFKPVMVTYDKLVEGLTVMAQNQPRHFGDFMDGNEDAETGDVFMQCVCFGKMVFG